MNDLRFSWLASSLLLLLALIGCVTEKETAEHSITLENPRTSNGLLTEEVSDAGLRQMQSTMDSWDDAEIQAAVQAVAEMKETASTPEAPTSNPQETPAPPTAAAAPTPNPEPAPPAVNYPANAGRLLPLGKMSIDEITELISFMMLKLETEQGYLPATTADSVHFPPLPAGIADVGALARHEADGTIKMMRFGYRTYTSQLPQIWTYGLAVTGTNVYAVNPDVELVKPAVDAAVAEIAQLRTTLTSADLDRKLIKLSYIDSANAIKFMKALGINAQANIDAVPATFNFDQLPLVAALPDPSEDAMGIVGSGANTTSGKFGNTMIPTTPGKLSSKVNASPASQLLVIYHPAHPEQFSRVKELLQKYVDRPARQILIEGMVLEIGEDGLDDLGVEWNFEDGSYAWMLGSLEAGGVFDTFDLMFDNRIEKADRWTAKIRALVREGKAEVLSRPSVLTLDNRQAAIRVGRDIPIATSQEGTSGTSNKVSFSFTYLPVGILLNIRPRIAADEREVSLLVDATVSATVPGEDFEIRSRDGDLLAFAPTIASRRVQTYARIPNKTPFIIGGLVSRDRIETLDKVPLLGDLPFIGVAFRSQKITDRKREVIIVLTPYVLPEDTVITPSLPRDDDLFDRTGNQLFRDAYRIRTEDVFDLSFLFENKRLMAYQELANLVLRKNYRLTNQAPFSEFAGGRIPGEQILVHRMIYEVIKRTKVDQRINPERIIYLETKKVEGYHVQFLTHMLGRLGGGDTMASFFKNQRGKAVTITYNYDRESMDLDKMATEPLPEVSLVDCADRDQWQQLLWDLNQPGPDGRQRFTIVIQSEKDLERLQRAMMLKQVITLNGGENSLSIHKFTVGRLLAIPQIKEDQVTVIDADVARYFYHTELYYAAALKKIEQTLTELDQALRSPAIQPYLNGAALPPLSEKKRAN